MKKDKTPYCLDCKRPVLLCNCYDQDDITDGNYEELEDDKEEPITIPPRIGKDDLSYSDLAELD